VIVNVLSVLIPVSESSPVIEAAGAEPAPLTVTTWPTAIVPETPSTVIVAESSTAPFVVPEALEVVLASQTIVSSDCSSLNPAIPSEELSCSVAVPFV